MSGSASGVIDSVHDSTVADAHATVTVVEAPQVLSAAAPAAPAPARTVVQPAVPMPEKGHEPPTRQASSDGRAGGGKRGGGGGGGQRGGCRGGSGGGDGGGGGGSDEKRSGTKRSTSGGAAAQATHTIPSALALIGSRDVAKRDAGLRMLVEIAAAAQESSCGEHEADSAATLAFRKAVVRAGGIRAIVRALRASYASEFAVLCHTDAATLVGELALESSGARRALVAAGCVRPLVALLASPSVNVQESVSCALCNLSADDGPKRIILASESGTVLPLLVTLAQSHSER